ncbi:hypothetical protein SKAU_G00119060 [Synaphobranchus kaupii]|uniref:Uncharacterized protein n=1 Tax=Synaphobranchus kaupii TaxID=118154 RepID=A0A9Q1FNS9_SYNKA|nr:hypothetical protein SKAU_G00119060 [Synaphobranchus kaupii]
MCKQPNLTPILTVTGESKLTPLGRQPRGGRPRNVVARQSRCTPRRKPRCGHQASPPGFGTRTTPSGDRCDVMLRCYMRAGRADEGCVRISALP